MPRKREFYKCNVLNTEVLEKNVFKKFGGFFVHVDEELYIPVNTTTTEFFTKITNKEAENERLLR